MVPVDCDFYHDADGGHNRCSSLRGRRLYCAPHQIPSAVEINPIKSEITALQERFDALRGYL